MIGALRRRSGGAQEAMMARRQISLFEDELSGRPELGGLVQIPQPDRPLTKAQRAFNRLVGKVEELRARLDREIRRLDEALAYYGEHLHPRLQRQKALRKDLVRALAPFLDRKRLKRKSERETLRMIIAEQISEIVCEEGSLTDDDLRALFEKVHGVDFGKVEQEEMEEARSGMEALFDELGIEIDLSGMRPDMSVEELAAKAAEMAETIRQKAEQEENAFRRPERRKTKRQLEKEERMLQAEQVRKKSIATIYKQLAKVLHPDLEPDDALRQRKVVLMQDLTTAYRNNDLHTLLRLELEWIQREEGDVGRLTEEKLGAYNQVLNEQVRELERELAELPYHPRYQPIAAPDGPFEIRLRTDGPAEARSLDEMIASMEASIARMRTGEALDEVRDAIESHRAASRIMHWPPAVTRRGRYSEEDAPF
jgi:hypothetical protein